MNAYDIWTATLAISTARFRNYAHPADIDELDALARQEYNRDLTEALTPLLNLIEVGIRNAVHNTMVAEHGRSDWYDIPGFLISTPNPGADDVRRVNETKRLLRQQGKHLTPDNIIGALTFGFWPGMFVRAYDAKIAIPVIQRRHLVLRAAIRSRADIERRLRLLYKLRNRIAHNEPIWNRPTLLQDYRDTMDTLHWFPPEFSYIAIKRNRFMHIYSGGMARQRLELSELLQHGDGEAFDPCI